MKMPYFSTQGMKICGVSRYPDLGGVAGISDNSSWRSSSVRFSIRRSRILRLSTAVASCG
jgi:hypothetical protein